MKKMIMILLIVIIFVLGLSCKRKVDNEENNNDEEIKNDTKVEDTEEIVFTLDSELINELLEQIKVFDNINYSNETNGKTIATKGIIRYTQKIYAKETKDGDNYYVLSKSSSTFANSYHEALFNSDSVNVKVKENDSYRSFDINAYRNRFGVVPWENFVGYIVNSDTITGIYRNDSFICIRLDNTLATVNMKTQMYELGGLSSEPDFLLLELKIYYNNKVEKVDVYAKYTIKKGFLGEFNCEQNLTITFDY